MSKSNKCPRCDVEFETVELGEMKINIIKDTSLMGTTLILEYPDGRKRVTTMEDMIKRLKDVQSNNN